jgi:hypothetical protein
MFETPVRHCLAGVFSFVWLARLILHPQHQLVSTMYIVSVIPTADQLNLIPLSLNSFLS